MNHNLLIKLLIKALKVDGNIAPDEVKFLHYVGQQLGVSVEEILHLEHANLQYSFPSNEQERVQILYYLLFAISSDKEITEHEKTYLHQLSINLGFRPNMVENMILVMEKYKGERIPDDALVNEIKPYLN